MDSFRAADVRAGSRLSQLYANTKTSSQVALPPPSEDATPEKRSLDRKFSLQKDRLIAWGFDWCDNLNTGEIDESVERAGLTEIVESILVNVKSVIEDVERMNAPLPAPATIHSTMYPLEKVSTIPASTRWGQTDYARYEDLVKDMTQAIDLLCELSKSRRAAEKRDSDKADLDAGESRSGKKRLSLSNIERPATPVPAYPQESTEVLSPGLAQVASPISHVESIPQISPSLLILPQEGPPGYAPGYGDSTGVLRGALSSPRLFGHLRRANTSDRSALDGSMPVMIEYANFDRIYKDTDMTLPLTRLQQFHGILRNWDKTSNALAKPIAYFEDPTHARYGLIFEVPQLAQTHQIQTSSGSFTQPTALSTLLHQASRALSTSATANVPWVPPLEDRFRLAQQLLKGIRFLQDNEFSHRNISSTNIAVLSAPSNNSGFDIRRPLICSVDLFSDFDVEPTREVLQQNIYRHPDDPRIMGPTAAREFEPRFDLYSLSLVLLEIGMWHPLADMYKEKYSLRDFKTRVAKVWIRRLAGRCGSAYARSVQELFAAGNRPQGEQTRAGVTRMLNRVTARIERCCSIDLEEDDDEVEEPPEMNANISSFAQEEEDAAAFTQAGYYAEPRQVSQPPTEQKTRRLLFQDLELPKDIIAQYQTFEGQVVRITEKILKKSKESCWIDLLYSGENRETARPTICVGCSSTKIVRSALKKHLSYDRSLFDLAVFKDTVRRSKTASCRRSKAGDEIAVARNPGHHQRPLCGSSIGAWRYGEHSAAVSFGGIVLIEDEPYGMTVHHLLEDPDADEGMRCLSLTAEAIPELQSSKIMSENPGEDEGFVMSDDEDETDLESMTDETPSLYEDSDDEADDDFTLGYQGHSAEEIILTQPALDDVEEGFFPSKEDEDDEHLLSHRLGFVHASSGLRHSDLDDGIKHEIDWLLMKLDQDRLQPYNVIAGGKKFCREDALFSYRPRLIDPVCRQEFPPREDLYPRRIVESSELPGLAVHAFGRTSGLSQGKFTQVMRWVRFHGRRGFSQVWSVVGEFGQGGDSGAWVVDNEQGRVCGHVLAWSSKFGVAYVSPMDVMFRDMQRILKVNEILLPGYAEKPRPLSTYDFDMSDLSLEEAAELKLSRTPLAKHMLHSGNPAHLEREWARRRENLGISAGRGIT